MPPLELNGTTGVSQVQTGAVESGDLPAGSVIQVVESTSSTNLSTNSSSFSNIPGLSVSITPATESSKIAIFYTVNVFAVDGPDWHTGGLRLLRDSTVILTDSDGGFGVGHNLNDPDDRLMLSVHHHIVDSPVTNNEVVYQVQAARLLGSNAITFNEYGANARIMAMEIAG